MVKVWVVPVCVFDLFAFTDVELVGVLLLKCFLTSGKNTQGKIENISEYNKDPFT